MTRARLVPCGSCSRHIRVTDSACPFCGAVLSSQLRNSPAPLAPQGQLSRAALIAFSAAAAASLGGVAVSSVGCSGQVQQVDDGGGDANNIAPMYGAPPDDAAAQDAATDSGPHDAGPDANIQPMYGMPPPDAGNQPPYGQPPPPDGGIQPPYGQPPPHDAGSPNPPSDGGFAPMYGMPPVDAGKH